MSFKRKFADYLSDKGALHRSPDIEPSVMTAEGTTRVESGGQGALVLSIFQRGEIKAKTIEIWMKSLKKFHDIRVGSTYDPEATHVILPAGCTRQKLHEWVGERPLPTGLKLVTAAWVVALINGAGVSPDSDRHIHPLTRGDEADGVEQRGHTTTIDDAQPCGTAVSASAEFRSGIDKSKFACARSGDSRVTAQANVEIISKLLELQRIYEIEGDQWRSLSYKKACAQLGRMKQITSVDDLRGVKSVGASILAKIGEILESGGNLTKLSNLQSRPGVREKLLFSDVWGIGPKTAQFLTERGYKSIQDLQDRGLSELNPQQRIGLLRYEDLQLRMPRDEAREISEVVISEACLILPGLRGMACGSYRRGKATCGDVDVLLRLPDVESSCGSDSNSMSCHDFMQNLLSRLKNIRFLTDDLSLPTSDQSGRKASYMGVCRLAHDAAKHRRIDIKLYPAHQFAFALLYFTGSDHFNRSMRAYAGKIGFTLSDEGLYKCRRLGAGVDSIKHIEHEIPCCTEKDIFHALDLPYKEPWERDCVDVTSATDATKG